MGERHAILTVHNAERKDDGPYRLQLDNDLGTDSAIIKVAVNGINPSIFCHYCNIYKIYSVILTVLGMPFNWKMLNSPGPLKPMSNSANEL